MDDMVLTLGLALLTWLGSAWLLLRRIERRPPAVVVVDRGGVYVAGDGNTVTRGEARGAIEDAENALANLARVEQLAGLLAEIAAAAAAGRFREDLPARVGTLAQEIGAANGRARESLQARRRELARAYRGKNGSGSMVEPSLGERN